MRGELDWIVMKRWRRTATGGTRRPTAWRPTCERYLDDEPVQACPPSAGYRLRKFARRNKGLLATTGRRVPGPDRWDGRRTWQAIRATDAERLAQTRLQAEIKAQYATLRSCISPKRPKTRRCTGFSTADWPRPGRGA